MAWFLVKSDPDEYSFLDLAKDGSTIWDGVHSFAAIGFIKQMKPGDMVLVYHSQKEKAIVGIARVSGKPFLNTDDPRLSWAVELSYVCPIQAPITLAAVKAQPDLQDFNLIRQTRLSVMAIPEQIKQVLSRLIPEISRW